MIVLESKRRRIENIRRNYPGAAILDVTHRSDDEFIMLSPRYPHNGIPVPFSPGRTSASAEGIWQGLKVFERSGIDTTLFDNRTMKGFDRTERQFGRLLGYRKGVEGGIDKLFSIAMAIKHIYAPAYRWLMENKAQEQVAKIKALADKGTVVLLDYSTNTNPYSDRPISHAWLLKAYIEGNYPVPTPSELIKALSEGYLTENDLPQEFRLPLDNLSKRYIGEWISVGHFGLGEIMEIDGYKAKVDFWPQKKEISLVADSVAPFEIEEGFSFIRESIRYKKRMGARELEIVACTDKRAVEVTVPESIRINGDSYPVTSIGRKAFAGLTELHSLSIPSSVRDIAPDAFMMSDSIVQLEKQGIGPDRVTLLTSRDGKKGVLADPARKISAIPLEYDEITFCAARLVSRQRTPVYYFLVKKDGHWGLLNKTGRVQAPCIYDELVPALKNGLLQGFAFRRGDTKGIIDGKGQETI